MHGFHSDDTEEEEVMPSDMTEDEVKKFKEDWKNLWNPDITKNELNFSLDMWHTH